ncbi:MAG: phosphate ABC transporter permease PstA [Desulfomonilia bacterium]|jgi:phosphate transport system permease protein|uniref:Phosphate transport system permease protein PstA n=1 Tax=anaerobic digester metagenome TaxID=1263854 RepID=A0A485LU39_9ZZZZ|nr:phosphate ABC transporter permease PstA [Pseudomonadota bacterium]HPD22234.1 phosphate ABC transporter permease PstA [Deltaproteobacteria bacterium]HPX19834.1 phosphate ABC transporter permease PstA [Deltaproteobacteria bacterium]HRS57067.1 phosphate ABC transporter permease PstA [Desulfomonilia bacterium]HRV36665.1 phosphate ABC transporter permease PstA [Desulfomonilia bacterium]
MTQNTSHTAEPFTVSTRRAINARDFSQALGFLFLGACAAFALFFLGSILYFVIVRGAPVISWEFLTSVPRKAMTQGGVAPAIVGTFYLTLGAIAFALPLGLACAIYLTEYSPKTILVNIIRLSIANLAGIPSIVFGLFGFTVFVKIFGFGVSILSGSLTLGIMALPGIIAASQEAILAVPQSYKEASLALGATHWQTIARVVLPSSLPGILTGVILNVGRVAGETAAILFTAATFYTRGYPDSLFSEVMALPYHIYALMTEGTHPESQTLIAYGSSLILLTLVLFISGLAIILRQRQRRVYGS